MKIKVAEDKQTVINADTGIAVKIEYWEDHPTGHTPSNERVERIGSFGLLFCDPYLCSCGTIVYDTDQ